MRLTSIRVNVVAALVLAACRGEARTEGAKVASAAEIASAGKDTSAGRSDERVRMADLARIRGDSNAKLWMVIASDFQCPFCKIWHDSTAAAIDKEYVEPGKIRIAYLNFPLNRHQHAVVSAEAAMCAGAQGKFWPMHDWLFETQNEWAGVADPVEIYRRHVRELQLNEPAWGKCMTEHVMVPMIRADYDRGVLANVRSTPSFFIGDTVLEGAQGIAEFRKALDKALEPAPPK